MPVILKEDMITKLKEVGLEKGDTVMVHTSLKRMGVAWIEKTEYKTELQRILRYKPSCLLRKI